MGCFVTEATAHAEGHTAGQKLWGEQHMCCSAAVELSGALWGLVPTPLELLPSASGASAQYRYISSGLGLQGCLDSLIEAGVARGVHWQKVSLPSKQAGTRDQLTESLSPWSWWGLTPSVGQQPALRWPWDYSRIENCWKETRPTFQKGKKSSLSSGCARSGNSFKVGKTGQSPQPVIKWENGGLGWNARAPGWYGLEHLYYGKKKKKLKGVHFKCRHRNKRVPESKDSIMGNTLIPFLRSEHGWVPFWSACIITHETRGKNDKIEVSVQLQGCKSILEVW